MKINEQEFLDNFKSEFFDSDHVSFNLNTIFKDLDEWDSLASMAIQVMIEDNYKVKVDPELFKKFTKIGDFYNYVSKSLK